MDLFFNIEFLLGLSFMNHLVGGFVFIGIFGSIMGINILKNEWYILFAALASVFPDIDIPTSPMGKIVLPISKLVNRFFGHRTITHSLIFLGATTFIVGSIDSYFTGQSIFTIIWFLGILSHHMYDMMTKAAIPWFYPFSNAIAAIPGDANLRFTSSNKKVELSIFTFFCLCIVFLMPLFESGFWTTYNRTFGTPRHLYSEFTKSSDLLEVDYIYRIASDEYQGRGYVIESNQNGATLLQGNDWLQLDMEKMIIKNLNPIHTGRKWEINQINFVAINADSLNNLMKGKHNLRTEIHSNNDFSFYFNGKEETGKVAKAVYFHNGKVKEQKQLIEKEQITFQPSPRIKTLAFQISNMKKLYNEKLLIYQNHIAAKNKLQLDISQEEDLFKRETAVRKLAQMKAIEKPVIDSEKIAMLEAQIREIKEADNQNYQTRLAEVETNYKSQLPEESHFTGYLKFVTIHPSQQLSAK